MEYEVIWNGGYLFCEDGIFAMLLPPPIVYPPYSHRTTSRPRRLPPRQCECGALAIRIETRRSRSGRSHRRWRCERGHRFNEWLGNDAA